MAGGIITYKILKEIGRAANCGFDYLIASLIAGPGSSPTRVNYVYSLLKKSESKNLKTKERDIFYEEKSRYLRMVSKLKKDGLLEKGGKGSSKFLSLTQKGEIFLGALSSKLTLPATSYTKIKEDFFTIITFDIPEQERKKRVWLRQALINLDFKMIQKSVWIGKVKIPKQFLEDLRLLKISRCVEIFQATKSGTLKKL